MARMCRAALAGISRPRARSTTGTAAPPPLFIRANPAPAKWALAQMGRIANELRLPRCRSPPATNRSAPLRRAGYAQYGITNA
jgi:4-hydroxy-tetrahydrodipicolinate synthase